MIDLKALEKNSPHPITGQPYRDAYVATLKGRGEDTGLVDRLLELNVQRKELINLVETQKAEQKRVSAQIGEKKKRGESAEDVVAEMAALREKIKNGEDEANRVQEQVDHLLKTLPNLCHPSVPVGASSEDNVIVRTVGEKPSFAFTPREHTEIGEKLGLLDFERAGKVTGARFAFLKGQLARLERALVNFMLQLHTRERGYTEIMPPFMVNQDSMFGTGQLPKFAADAFKINDFPFYMVPTAEVPVTNLYRDEILSEEDLPQCFAAYSPCFRSEAGSHGRDTKGLIRQHQFNKVELMIFSHPEKSYEMHEKLVSDAEEVLKRLELPYRVVSLCTGDIGFAAAKCYDLEVWLPGQNAYREISSCSNCEDFQARRANIRFREKGGKPQFVHTLNGSGLAVGRTLLAILENYQQEDGRVRVPAALMPFMDGLEWIGG